VPRDSIPERISPVNAARLLLRQYFCADLPALEDWTFWSSAAQPYLFEKVAESP
jgi:hypothetical protein